METHRHVRLNARPGGSGQQCMGVFMLGDDSDTAWFEGKMRGHLSSNSAADLGQDKNCGVELGWPMA
eukprot:8570231-Pyramimonas_sp.AAC.1